MLHGLLETTERAVSVDVKGRKWDVAHKVAHKWSRRKEYIKGWKVNTKS